MNRRFEQLHREHTRELERRLRSMQPWVHPSIHQDILQDVWIVVHRKLAEVPADDGARPWLIAVMRKVLLHYARSYARARRKTEALGEFESIRPNDGRRAEDGLFLGQVLGDLPDDQREVVIRSEMYGESAPEIAARLDKPVNTVYSRLRLARERIARLGVAVGLWIAWLRADASGRLVRTTFAAAAVVVAVTVLVVGRLWSPSYFGSAVRSDEPMALEARPTAQLPCEEDELEARVLRPSAPAAPTPPRTAAPVERVSAAPEPLLALPTPPAAPDSRAAAQEATQVVRREDRVVKEKNRDIKLLSRARVAIEKGNPRTALRLVQRFRRGFPRHEMAITAAGIEIDAFCLLGRPVDARAAYDRAVAVFTATAPHLVERKKTKCW